MSSKLASIISKELSYNEDNKNKFHRQAKRDLKEFASRIGLSSSDYDLRSNKGGIAVSGEVTLHADNIYIQISKPCYGKRNEILFRTCNGRKDYTGNTNNFTSAMNLLEDDYLKDRVKALVNNLTLKEEAWKSL